MCGRYAFYQRPSEIRRQLEDAHMPVDDCPNDEGSRQTYNFPPGAIGIVYRADVPDYGAGPSTKHGRKKSDSTEKGVHDEVKEEPEYDTEVINLPHPHKDVRYKLQFMKWGLVPSWTKRSPDYPTILRTINARDDSLMENRGLWNVPKRRKRCIVLAQGFYEWLKKNNGKDRIPHYIKRKDNQLMCMAGLWDCVRYEDSDEKQYTYTIITTEANKQISFLHDRMPVIFDNGSDAMRKWLDPNRYEWTNELQSLLKPFEGELEIYPVNKDVGKVGNNSPSFVVPLDSAANKSNIANFFGNHAKKAKNAETTQNVIKTEKDVELESGQVQQQSRKEPEAIKAEMVKSDVPSAGDTLRGIKREFSDEVAEDNRSLFSPEKTPTLESPRSTKQLKMSPIKQSPKKMRSATSNGSAGKGGSPAKSDRGTQKITKFFGK
ncbi:uncharacterized protein PV09_01569 [Verruconis gallopava]|uniref:Abasic site processing protein n=1 Tax=Verruconis gallopava TaxID=253628 RepID=A0A0D1Z3R9_9PEZI|nr:uncharacterized protein PV09_01569 [Verruconis gallopava]KIW07622.1 hypothetical protein PV09_01569 [Verruconis gallopava]